MPYPEKTLQSLDHYKHHLAGKHEDLSAGQTPGVMLISCSDSRIMGSKILHPKPGNVFTHDNIGALVQDKEESDPSLDAFLNYPLLHLKGIHTIMIMGHTGCGGIKALTQSILNDAQRHTDNISGWVVPLSNEQLVDAAKRARERGLPDADIASSMEQIMPLLSARRLMERKLISNGQEITVGDILKEKNIQVVPSVYDLKSNRLYVFDPDSRLYTEAERLAKPAKKMAFAKGSSSAMGTTLPMASLDTEIQGMIDNLSAGKPSFDLAHRQGRN